MPHTPPSVLTIDNLHLSRGGIRILQDVRMDVRAGEIYGLIGPNGAGKSTTIAAILGFLPPEGGKISLFGQSKTAAAPDIRQRLGVLPEQNGFYDWMTAADYLRFFAALYRRPLTPQQAADRLRQVGLQPRIRQSIGTFSRGMRQRLGLARALIGNPDLLILDEPTNGLDPRGRREIHDILLNLAGTGVGILLCTHLLDDVERLCQRVGIIVDGKTVADGALSALIKTSSQLSRYRLRLAGEIPKDPDKTASIVARDGDWLIVEIDAGIRPDEAWRTLLIRGWPIAEVRRDGNGLEDLYLALTERRAA